MSYCSQLEEILHSIEHHEVLLKTHHSRKSELCSQVVDLEEQLEYEEESIQILESELVVLDDARNIFDVLAKIEEEGASKSRFWIIRQLDKVQTWLPEATSIALSEAVKSILADEWHQRYVQLYKELQFYQVEVYLDIAEECEDAGKVEKAIQALKDAWLICESLDCEGRQCKRILQWLARLKREQIESVKECLETIELYEILGDIRAQSHIWRNIAHYREDSNNQLEALEAYAECLRCLGLLNDDRYALEYYQRDLKHVCRLGRGLGTQPTKIEKQVYQSAIIDYEKWKSIEGLDQIAMLAESRRLANVQAEAVSVQKQVLMLIQKENGDMRDYVSVDISSVLYNELRDVLSRCGPFSSDRELQAVFVDNRICPWRGDVPQANSRSERIDALINFLIDKQNAEYKSVLVLFLHVLQDRTHPGDACYQQFADLVASLEQGTGTSNDSQMDTPIHSNRDDIAVEIQNKKQELAKYEKQLHRLNMKFASYGGENRSPLEVQDQHDEIVTIIEKLKVELDNLQQ